MHTVPYSGHLGGDVCLWGVCPEGSVCPGGVCPGMYLPYTVVYLGVSAQGGVHPLVDKQTPVKT